MRFYINSIYYYVYSLFLVDATKDSHKGLSMGGSAISALYPIGLDDLLKPINSVLVKSVSDKFNFGKVIQRRRNKRLVHGNFSIQEIENLAVETRLRDSDQQLKFRVLIWELFHRTLVFDLRLVSIFTFLNVDIEKVSRSYLSKIN